jgi:simple sugar transport system ATP-binding protein
MLAAFAGILTIAIAQQLREGLLAIQITRDIFQVHRIADGVVIMENGAKVADERTTR